MSCRRAPSSPPRRGDGHRAGRGRAQARPGCRGHGHRERGGLERLPGGPQSAGPRGRQARHLRRPRGGSWRPSAPAAGCAWQRASPTRREPPVQWREARGLWGCVTRLVRTRPATRGDPELSRAIWEEAGALGQEGLPKAAEIFSEAEDSAHLQAFPEAHWAKLRTNNVQERANRASKRRYRVVRSSLGRVDGAPERGLHLGRRALGNPARQEESAALGRDPGLGGPLEGREGGAREEGRTDSLGDSRELRPQEGVGFRQRRQQVMCLLTPRSCARSRVYSRVRPSAKVRSLIGCQLGEVRVGRVPCPKSCRTPHAMDFLTGVRRELWSPPGKGARCRAERPRISWGGGLPCGQRPITGRGIRSHWPRLARAGWPPPLSLTRGPSPSGGATRGNRSRKNWRGYGAPNRA